MGHPVYPTTCAAASAITSIHQLNYLFVVLQARYVSSRSNGIIIHVRTSRQLHANRNVNVDYWSSICYADKVCLNFSLKTKKEERVINVIKSNKNTINQRNMYMWSERILKCFNWISHIYSWPDGKFVKVEWTKKIYIYTKRLCKRLRNWLDRVGRV